MMMKKVIQFHFLLEAMKKSRRACEEVKRIKIDVSAQLGLLEALEAATTLDPERLISRAELRSMIDCSDDTLRRIPSIGGRGGDAQYRLRDVLEYDPRPRRPRETCVVDEADSILRCDREGDEPAANTTELFDAAVDDALSAAGW